MTGNLRDTGLEVTGRVPWGTHFCQFYQSRQDLIDILVPYLKAGLENNEFCMWVTAESLNRDEAEDSLRKAVPDLDAHRKKGQIEIIPYTEWYLKDGRFDAKRVLDGWVDKLQTALKRGYDGLRLTGNTIWLEKKDWKSFTDYEEEVNSVIGRYRMIALCTYSLDSCGASEVIDVVKNHQFAIVKRESGWDIVESSERKKADARYRIIADKTYDFEFWINTEGRYIYASPSCTRISGYPAEAFLKDPGIRRSLVHPEDRERFDEHVRKVENGRITGEMEYRLIRRDGSLVWIAHVCCPVYDDTGLWLGVRGSNRNITERKRAERETVWLASFPSLNPEPVIETDVSGNLHYLNAAAKRLFPDLEERGPAHPFLSDLKRIAGIFTKEVRRDFSREIKIGDVWFQQYFHNLPNARRIRVYSMDITAQKNEEEKFRKLNRTLKALSDSDQVMMRAASEEDLLRDICKIIVEDCGYSMVWIGFSENDENKSVRPVAQAGFDEGYIEKLNITWADTARGRGPTGTAIRTGKPTICRNILTDPNFEPWRKEAVKRGYASSMVVPLISGGTTLGAINIYSKESDPFVEEEIKLLTELANDLAYGITAIRLRIEHAKVEEDLHRTSGFLENLFSYANAPIICWNTRYRITRFNHAFEHLSDYRTEEVIGRNLSMLFPKGSKKESLSKIRRTLAGEQWESAEIPILCKDGSIRTVLWNSANVYAEDGKTLLGTIAQGQDITERIQAEKILKRDKETFEKLVNERTRDLLNARLELERSKRLSDIGTLAATVAHELRNPLAAITMAASNIRRKANNLLLDTHLKNIEKKVSESDQIIDNLLFYSRIRTPHYENVYLFDILDECIGNVQTRFRDKRASILKQYGSLQDIIIRADPLQMKELFLNILSNAYDAIPDSGGRIEARGGIGNGYITLRFKDNGAGISVEDVDKVFDPFFTTKAKGTGLGLSVCYQIVKTHEGTIHVKSIKSKGTTVSVNLPSRLSLDSGFSH